MDDRAEGMASENSEEEGLGPEIDEKIPTTVVKWSGKSRKESVG